MATQENRSGVGAFIGFIGFSTLAGLLVTVGVTPAIAVLGVTTTSTIDVFDSLPEYIEIGDLPQRNEVLAYQGGQPVHLATVYAQNREELQLDEISEYLRYAAVDGEDKRFWDHGGVDASSVVRAAVGSLASGGLGGSGGASTLTMQLVRNIKMQQALELPTQEEVDAAYREAIEPSASRKLAEMKLAIGLEKQYSKKEILAAYLNIAYFGDQTSVCRPRRSATSARTRRTSHRPRLLRSWRSCSGRRSATSPIRRTTRPTPSAETSSSGRCTRRGTSPGPSTTRPSRRSRTSTST